MSKLSLAVVLFALTSHAQWNKVPPTKAPMTAKGEIDMKAPAPRTANGKPDLTGPWSSEDNRYLRDIALNQKPDAVVMLPWAQKLFDERKDGSHSAEDPDAHCLPQGTPKIDFVQYPWKMVETPNSMVVIYETFNYWRQIFTDGRQMDPDANPTWMGYSTGKWEGDVFVIDSRGFNGRIWLDQLGRPSTDKLHVIERFHRINYGTMNIEAVIDDPGTFTKPFTVKMSVQLRPGWEPNEFICGENNTDIPHLPGKTGGF